MRLGLVPVLVILLLVAVTVPSFANLLTNGDFETGNLNGWTVWKAGWGGGNHAVVQSAAKYYGNYGLNLYIDSGQSTSFGVYQTVQVTPGVKYKVSGYWKGSYTPNYANWFEIIVLDGMYNLYGADDPAGVKPNLASVYDPAYKQFGWEPISNAYAYNSSVVKGERVATGNWMTVICKVGGSGAPVGYFDNITFEAVPEPSSLVALAGGLMGLAGIYRRKK